MAAIKREVTTGVAAAAGAGATQLRIVDSPGLRLDRSVIQSNERRGDLLKNMGRLGGRSVGGSFNAELTLGGATDLLLESILRSVWQTAVAITETTATSITTTANTIVRTAGSWIDDGVRVGDIVTLTDHATAANNGLRLRVESVSALTLTVAGNPLTANAVADSAFTLTILKKLSNLAEPVRYSYTIEQYDEDIDLSELFLGCRLTGLALSFRPNAIAMITYTFMGMNRDVLVIGTSPWFTDPDLTTGLPLIADDSVIRHDGADVTRFTGLDLNLQIAASGQPVIGSFVSPDIFDNELTISGQIMGVREDFSRILMYEAETEFELSALFTEPGTSPIGALGLYLPRVKISSLDAPFQGGEGAKIETMNIMVAPQSASAGNDATAINIFSTAA